MSPRLAGALGGVLAGLATTAVMVVGRKSGLLSKTLDRDSVDWIDRTTGSREIIGDTGTSLVEFANHIGASAAFGYGYAHLREQLPDAPDWAIGAGYGAGLYAVNIAGVAPLLGITEGEVQAGPRKAAERLGLHLLQTVLTAVIAERWLQPRLQT
jgi:hypothetical protein